ncbi:MAG: 16S rRNA (cytosine(1402)-N(4))-methyltransferase RsmH [Dehalococcoidia bacterium]
MVSLAVVEQGEVNIGAIRWGTFHPLTGLAGDMTEESFHQPVLLRESVEHLRVRPDGVYVDGTVGDGGHTLSLLRASAPRGRVLGIDRDPRSLARAIPRLISFGDRFTPVQGKYSDMAQLARDQWGPALKVDGILLDLGISSQQVDGEGYGFSFQRDEPLDMRFDPEEDRPTAAEIINGYPEADLAQILWEFGEESRSRAIARAIVRSRPISTTGALAGVVAAAVGGRRGRRTHPATRTFQALRIAVNDELASLEAGLEAAIGLLADQGRLAVISYHSLEDRLVKNFLVREATQCICPPELPVCVCDHQPTVRLVNRRILRPSPEEVAANPRSRSARLRVAERL